MKLRERSDLAVVVAWTVVALVVAGVRREFIGDGLRHVTDAAAGIWKLGEPRWLLFPGFLTAWFSLWRGLGVELTTVHAIELFLALDVIAGVTFLIALRELLHHMQVPVGRRALALALAGACGPLLELSTNTAEPMVAAALAVVGLLVAAKARPEPHLSWHTVAGATIIFAAGLLYQGIILALGLLPAVVPRGALFRARTLLAAAALLVAVWGGAAVALAHASSTPLAIAAVRFTRNGDNDLYARWLKSSSSTPRLVAMAVGPAAGISMPPHFTGVRAMLEGVRRGAPISLTQALALAVGAIVFWVLLGSSLGQRRGWLVAAVASIMILPLLRPSQYAYSKFYVLLPVFVALAAVHLRGAVTASLVCLLAMVNGYLLDRTLSEGRALFAERARAYETASPDDCFVTQAWIPAVPQAWPGRTCSLLAALAMGRGGSMGELMAEQKDALRRCLGWCYCDARSVWTDDMTSSRLEELRALAGYFGAPELADERLLWSDASGHVVLRGEAGMDVLRFDDNARTDACHSLRP